MIVYEAVCSASLKIACARRERVTYIREMLAELSVLAREAGEPELARYLANVPARDPHADD